MSSEPSKKDALISRFSIALPSCILFGLGIGATFPIEHGLLPLLAGIIGLTYYFIAEYRDKVHASTQNELVRARSEQRLAEQSSAIIDLITSQRSA